MAGRITVAASIAGTAVIVSGIVGVVTFTDMGARADNAGSRVSVAKIDVAAPAHPTPFPVTSKDSDIPAPAVPETVPAPEPGEVVTSPAKASKTTTAKSEAASKASGNRRPAAGQNPAGQNPAGQNPAGQSSNGQGAQSASTTGGTSDTTGQSRLNAPVRAPKLVQRDGIIAQAPVHGNGRDADNGRGHDKSVKTQSRESSPAHRD